MSSLSVTFLNVKVDERFFCTTVLTYTGSFGIIRVFSFIIPRVKKDALNGTALRFFLK
jgi:hypothetical protein